MPDTQKDAHAHTQKRAPFGADGDVRFKEASLLAKRATGLPSGPKTIEETIRYMLAFRMARCIGPERRAELLKMPR